MQDSDSLWQAAPPARQALHHMLSRNNATLTMAWTVVRDAPLANAHAGPTCAGSRAVHLADDTRQQMADMLKAMILHLLSFFELLAKSDLNTACAVSIGGRERKCGC